MALLVCRVNGIGLPWFSMISTSIISLGMLISGPISDFIKIEWLLIGTGLLMFIQGFFLLGSKVLIEAGKPNSEEGSLKGQLTSESTR
jgi:hypothetical protein